MKDRYARRIGREEARLGRIAVSKADLGVFPAPGEPFRATAEGDHHELRVESYPCECRGPAKPHEHRFIAWPGVREGDTVTFVREGERSYRVEMAPRTAG